VDPEELTAFRAGDNRILELEREIGAFGGLRTIDVSVDFSLWIGLIVATCKWAQGSARQFCRFAQAWYY
jgi:hypothetical protein